ncbi:hypothetical protein NTE_00513 [Candidatus Nitrososphaera evergladensis SR1]|uniref:Uncharacterized protein n=1 Tax=Candidatus Nitrososphaera evergladensis SR1 TaxID=1459636 RepID=A0A075MTG9_9ARCH|nr:hypothetical protein NTE_00513 [Candidatus Nitrososphaera evergladensis SR1]
MLPRLRIQIVHREVLADSLVSPVNPARVQPVVKVAQAELAVQAAKVGVAAFLTPLAMEIL